MVFGMNWSMTSHRLLVFLGATLATGAFPNVIVLAGAAAAGSVDDACAISRDRALKPLQEEAIAIEAAFDNDSAISGAAEYHLEEARKALIADIDRQRDRVEWRYRQCVAGTPAGRQK